MLLRPSLILFMHQMQCANLFGSDPDNKMTDKEFLERTPDRLRHGHVRRRRQHVICRCQQLRAADDRLRLGYLRFSEPFYSVSRFTLVSLDTVTLIQSALDDEEYSWLKES